MHETINLAAPDNEVLFTVAPLVNLAKENVDDIITGMQRVLSEHETGVGLAANQVGISKRIIVLKRDPFYAINPQVIKIKDGKAMVDSVEGCLSLPGKNYTVQRYKTIQVRYLDKDGFSYTQVITGYDAAIWQHEIDHLDGKVVWEIDRPTKGKS